MNLVGMLSLELLMKLLHMQRLYGAKENGRK